MASHRPYRPGLGLEQAMNEISQHRGTLYDTAAVDACLALLRQNRLSFWGDQPWW
jgi:HD-GYP domain-containing protein (c-di-GMP phosphodiesterase class II)